jgi:parallel beta helix pectate lyase-like protein
MERCVRTAEARVRTRPVLAIALLAVVAFLLPGHASAAGVECGATISQDTTLTASDPVVFEAGSSTDTPCRSTGLTVKGGVTLDCDGRTIKGKGVGTGIRVVSGDSATIQNCIVDSFSVGVQVAGHGSHTVQNVRVVNNKSNGLAASGGQNTITRVVSANNGGVGFAIRGNDNFIGQANVALGNARGGFSFSGNGQIVDSNHAVNNGAAGFFGSGHGSSFTGNNAVGNKGAGFTYRGGTVSFPNDAGTTAAITNGGNGVVLVGTINTAIDDGGNIGEANLGAIQCQIGGAPCQ